MSAPTKYMLVSLPASISSHDQEDAFSALRSIVAGKNIAAVVPFKIPNFKIGTLDALVQQADDLAKIENSSGNVVAKVGEALRSLLEGDEDKILQQKTINDKPPDQYLRSFSWNKIKYHAEKPISELISCLQKELISIDNDVKVKLAQYNQAKSNLSLLQRKQNGNLSTKSLTTIVDPSILIQDSEYLETHLIAVPKKSKKEFLHSYETLVPMVVPRSSFEIAQDDEFALFTVTIFKKYSAEFQNKCREMKWIPRDFKHVAGGKEKERKELERAIKDERKVWGEALRMFRTGWSECMMIWIHVLALRVYVETVLRYGLPLNFTCGLIKSDQKSAKKVKALLDSAFSYLGGNAFGRDKSGKTTKDDPTLSAEMAAAGVASQGGEGSEYTAYVYYDFEIV